MDTLKHSSVVLAFVAALAACTGTAPSRPGVETGPLESRAEAAAEEGDLAEAVELYDELAAATSGRARAGYLLEAARLEIEAGRASAAAERLTEVRSIGSGEQRDFATVLRARIDLEQGRAEAALDRLSGVSPSAGDPALLSDAAAVRGRALFAVGRTAEAVRELTEREIWLDSADAILANQRLIWEGLENLPPDSRPEPTGDTLVDGWLALAPVARIEPGTTDFRVELLRWRSAYADHPAAGGLLAELVSAGRGEATRPQNIALLLPLGGAQRQAALAIRDGFMAGRFEADDDAAIRVYDTAARGATDAYQQAQLEGADFIVGPLLRPDVEQVIDQSGFVPTLALNFTERAAPFLQSFYQFALSPEDEASAIAERAIAAGETQAVALVASNDWGYRVLDAFRDEYEALGGELLEFSGYDPSVSDFTGPITTVLDIDASEARRRRLAENLGVSLAFEPRRRQDVDMIFLAADASAGRLLVPQLRFHAAGDVPMYATRDIHDPTRTQRDTDLNGVRFPDAPLLLEPGREAATLRRTIERFWPDDGTRWLRFYGMGYDAYELAQALYDPGSRSWPIAGVSGRLRLDEQGRIRRGLPFAEFRNGEPVALEPLPWRIGPSSPALSRR